MEGSQHAAGRSYQGVPFSPCCDGKVQLSIFEPFIVLSFAPTPSLARTGTDFPSLAMTDARSTLKLESKYAFSSQS